MLVDEWVKGFNWFYQRHGFAPVRIGVDRNMWKMLELELRNQMHNRHYPAFIEIRICNIPLYVRTNAN